MTSKARNPDWSRDELILALNLYMAAGRKQLDAAHPDVQELSDLLNRLPIHKASVRFRKFRNGNGVSMKLGNFTRFDPDHTSTGLRRGNHLEKDVWNEFADDPERLQQVASHIAQLANFDDEQFVEGQRIDEEEFPEGKLLARLHRYRERDPRAAKKKKESILKRTGKLECEVCGFDFQSTYGFLGEGFAECHHRTPICKLTLETKTRLGDLAIVCSNCHRMLHRSRPMSSIDQLKAIMATLA